VLLGWLSACCGAWPQGEFRLQYKDQNDFRNNPLLELGQWLKCNKTGPTGHPKVFEDRRLHFDYVRIGGTSVLIGATEDPNAGIYFDRDRDHSLVDEKPIPKRGGNVERWCGPAVLQVAGPDGAKLEARFNVVTATSRLYRLMLVVSPAGYRLGQVRLGGADYRIALVDANLNGTYNDLCPRHLGSGRGFDYDYFAFDVNRDGRFDFETEFAPLPRMVMAGGVLYRLSVAPDGSMVRLTRETPDFELGQIEFAANDSEMVVFSPIMGIFTLSGAAGKGRLPTGNYMIMRALVVRTGEDGAKWAFKVLSTSQAEKGALITGHVVKDSKLTPVLSERIMGPPGGGHLLVTTVHPSRIKMAGPPFRLSTDARREQVRGEVRSVLVEATLRDEKIQEYFCAPIRDGRQLGPPAVRIVDEQGRVLGSGTMHYSWRGRAVWSWRIPEGFKGTFRALVTVDGGPFEIVHDERWFKTTSLGPITNQ